MSLKRRLARLERQVKDKIKCPVCGECYLTEEIAMTMVKEAEEAIYGK